MADEKKQIPLVDLFRRSRLTTSPVTLIAGMPVSSPAMVRTFCPQVSFKCVFRTDAKTDETVVDKTARLECHPYERESSEKFSHDIDATFRRFAVEGAFTLSSGQQVQCVRPDGYDIWPDRYTLRPLFEAKHLESQEEINKRLKCVADQRNGDPVLIYVPGWMIESALADGEPQLCTDSESGDSEARFCQRCPGEDGRPELWIGVLPPRLPGQKPDKEGKLKILPEQNGTVVRLTADFLERFVPVAQVLFAEMGLFYQQLYIKNS